MYNFQLNLDKSQILIGFEKFIRNNSTLTTIWNLTVTEPIKFVMLIPNDTESILLY